MGGLRALSTPLSSSDVKELRAGDLVELSGEVVVARDRAHARLLELRDEGRPPPVNLEGGVVFHAGPVAVRTAEGWRVLSMGPTTSARFEELVVEVVEGFGVRAVIGKGGLSPSYAERLREAGAVYLAYPGGAGVLAAKAVFKVLGVHWLDLGVPEALWVLEVRRLAPLLVAVDLKGRDLYEEVSKSAELVLRDLSGRRKC